MRKRFVHDAEVGGEHGGGEFAAVGAVADKGGGHVGAFDGLGRVGVSFGVLIMGPLGNGDWMD